MHGWMDCWLLKVFQLLPWDEVLVATTLVMERASARARARACVCVRVVRACVRVARGWTGLVDAVGCVATRPSYPGLDRDRAARGAGPRSALRGV